MGDDLGVGWAQARLVVPLMQMSRHDEAEAAGRTAVELLEPLGESAELAQALHTLGWFLWRRGRELEAEPMLRRAVDIAARLDEMLLHAEATQTLAVCVAALGRSVESVALMEEAFRLAKEAGDNANLMRAYNNVSGMRGATMGPVAAAEVLREGLELALRSGSIGNAGWIAGSLGDTLLLLGQLDEAEGFQRQAVELARRVGDEPLLGMRLLALAAVRLLRGRIDEATVIRDEALPVMAANPEPQSDLFLPWFDAYLAYARGDVREAAERFVEAAELLLAFNVDSAPELLPECVRQLVLLGEAQRAAGYQIDGSGSVQTSAHTRTIEGLLEPDAARSAELLEGAVADLEALGMRIHAAQAMVDLGRAMARAGRDPRPVLERAREILVECDARLFLPEVDEVLAALDG